MIGWLSRLVVHLWSSAIHQIFQNTTGKSSSRCGERMNGKSSTCERTSTGHSRRNTKDQANLRTRANGNGGLTCEIFLGTTPSPSTPNRRPKSMNQNQMQSKPADAEQPTDKGLDKMPCCGFFICPDGDLHSRRPVEAIWIEQIGHLWNRKHRVCLQFKGTDTHEWEWDQKTRAEAVSVRDRLISILHNANCPSVGATELKP